MLNLLVTVMYMMGSQKVPGMVVLHCDGRTYGNGYLITFKAGPLCTHTCSINTAIVESTDGRLLSEYFGVRLSHSVWHPSSMVVKHVPSRPIFRAGNSHKVTFKDLIHSEWVQWIIVVGWCQEYISRRGIAAQQAMCGSVHYRDAETTDPHTCRAASSEVHHATSAELVCRNGK
jgi:hypothetical protein